MSERTQARLEKWIETLSGKEEHEIMDKLGLKTTGVRMARLGRLEQWLLGDYDESMFAEMIDISPEEAKILRKSNRDTFMKENLGEPEEAEFSEDNTLTEALTAVAEDPQVISNLSRIPDTLPVNPAKESGVDQAGQSSLLETTQDQPQNANASKTADSGGNYSIKCTLETGEEIVTDKRVVIAYGALAAHIEELEKKVEQLSKGEPTNQQLPSSTRYEQPPNARQLGFRDTFALHNHQTCSSPFNAFREATTH